MMAEPRILRFNRTQRALHWSHSITFMILLATGIVLLVKQVGEVVGHHLLILQFHEYTSLFYIFGPLLWVLFGRWGDQRQRRWSGEPGRVAHEFRKACCRCSRSNREITRMVADRYGGAASLAELRRNHPVRYARRNG